MTYKNPRVGSTNLKVDLEKRCTIDVHITCLQAYIINNLTNVSSAY